MGGNCGGIMQTLLLIALMVSMAAPAASPLLTTQSQAAAQTGDLQAAAEAVAKYFRADPAGIDRLFTPGFLAQVPAAKLEAVMKQLYGQLGSCTGVKLDNQAGPGRGQFQFTFDKGFTAPITLVIDDTSRAISGFVVGPPVSSSDTLSSLVDKMKALPGQVSFLAQRLDPSGPVTLAEWQPAQELAIGSAFKLYVLGALATQVSKGGRRWSDVMPLETQSLPSGILQKWPVGTPMTLQGLASLMISISDNTAADALLKAVGRDAVEAMMPVMGHGQPALNRPFLSTMDMFQLKWGVPDDQQQSYLAADAAARRSILQAMKPPSSTSSLLTRASSTVPKLIDKLEWFASASDLCRAMAWFQADDSPRATARQILAINPGIPAAAARWAYVGFKGGGEPGVISLNFLLRSQANQWYTVGAVWNDPKAAVSDTEWVGLVGRALELLK
jgi:beta-lactamase class A